MKKLLKKIAASTLCIAMVTASVGTAIAASWRSTNSKTVNKYKLSAKANLPYWSDSQGGGSWRTEATYSGSKDGNKLTNSWSFYSIGGTVSASYSGVGASITGHGTSTGGSFTAKGSSVKANGYVYGTGLCFYVGLISTASFTKGNTYYSISTKI